MSKRKGALVLLLGGIGWLLMAITCAMMGALDNTVGVWLCVVSAALGLGMVCFGVDKLLEPPERW